MVGGLLTTILALTSAHAHDGLLCCSKKISLGIMPHEHDVMQHGCPCGDERQAWLFGFSDLFGVEGDHGGVVIARLEHNQILAGAEASA